MRFFSKAILIAAGLVFASFSAHAQTSEKRIALVVGNSNYPDHVLATTANDGGLIAQTLQAAGFDVVGARDLDAESLRRAFKDFVQKAQASGPDTVAFVYFSGYGLQLAGENYFLPVDAAPARDTDVAVEGLRLSDYVRQLQVLPLKAGVVVLDAAREQPFAKSGEPLAGGLALVEADPKILTAFNAAPGTVAPEAGESYSPYAQALAEMIRTGGLTLPEVFDRVRLRVNDVTKGAQIPWDTRKIDANVMFFERAADAPQQAAAPVAETSKPISAYDANAAYTAALARDTLPDYDAFVTAYPNDPLAKRVRAIIAARREAITWRRSYLVNSPESYWSYLRRYPRGPHAFDARRRLAFLTAPPEPPPSFAMISYDVPPPPPEEIVYVERPVLVFSDPYFAFAPPPPPPVYFLPPPPPDFIVLAPPPPVFGLFILPRPVFVPIPVYVVAPRYVLPPQNNIVFANIHNAAVVNRPAPPLAGGPQGRPGTGLGAAPGGPALPPSVAQRAALIQQGKLAPPPGVAGRASATPGGALGGAPAGQRIGAPLPGAGGSPLPQTGQNRAGLPSSGAGKPGLPVQRAGLPPHGGANPAGSLQAARPSMAARTPQMATPPRPPSPPATARIATPRAPMMPPRPQPQIQRAPPMQAMARPAGPPRMMRPAGPPPRGGGGRPQRH